MFSGLSRNARCGFRNSSLRQHGACSIEIRSKAHNSRCAAVNNDCTTTVGHWHTDDFCAINCAAVAATFDDPARADPSETIGCHRPLRQVTARANPHRAQQAEVEKPY